MEGQRADRDREKKGNRGEGTERERGERAEEKGAGEGAKLRKKAVLSVTLPSLLTSLATGDKVQDGPAYRHQHLHCKYTTRAMRQARPRTGLLNEDSRRLEEAGRFKPRYPHPRAVG